MFAFETNTNHNKKWGPRRENSPGIVFVSIVAGTVCKMRGQNQKVINT